MAVHTLLTLGGVLAGDCNTLQIELAENTAARVVMAAATQVLRMPHGHAEQHITIRLHAGSSLEWLAEPTILFGQAAFHQQTKIIMSNGSRLVFLDVLVPGRLARGEVHQYRQYRNTFTVYDEQGNLLVSEHNQVDPLHLATAVPGVLRNTPVVGSLYILGNQVDAQGIAASIGEQGEERIAANVLPNNAGVLIRALGESGSAVRGRLMKLRVKG